MRQEKRRRRWPWVVLLVLVLAAVAYGFVSKYQAEQPLPQDAVDTFVLNVDNDEAVVDETDSSKGEPEFTAEVTGTVEVGEFSISDEQLALMQQFMDGWYVPLAQFDTPDFGGLFTHAEDADSHADALRTLITIREAALTDLRMKTVDYTLTVTDVSEEDGCVRVEADETAVMRFAATPDTDSILYDMPHIFSFDSDSDTISHHEADDNPYFSFHYDEEGSDYDAEIQRILRSIERRQLLQGETAAVSFEFDHAYDRAAAEEYMRTYCSQRNDRWYAYDAVGGNCMNFGSQVLLAGGIPMDESGSEKWYWHGQNKTDLSWINVGNFYDYARKNEGYGLVADVEAGYYTGEVGDILLIGFNGGHNHTTLISDVVYDQDGNVVDYLVCCNTTNYQDFPAGAYYYTSHRLVKIYGWNEG